MLSILFSLFTKATVTIGVLYVIVYTYYFIALRPKKIPGFSGENRVVVISGCDSGFGYATALHLVSLGYTVIAGCYTEKGMEQLQSEGHQSSLLHVIQCDVTKEEDIDKMVHYTKKLIEDSDAKGNTLKMWGLINNAGIAPSGFVDWISMKSVRAVMEVNYFAIVAMSKAFLPLLKTTRGSRVINLSSAAGYSGFPGGSSYCASKHAVEGFAKCFRQECMGWNIHVCNVNPGFMKTPLLTVAEVNAYKEFEAAPKEITSQYPATNISDFLAIMYSVQEDPSTVVNTITSLLEQENPLLLNPSGWQAHVVRWLFHIIPHGIICATDYRLKVKPGFGPFPEVRKNIQVK